MVCFAAIAIVRFACQVTHRHTRSMRTVRSAPTTVNDGSSVYISAETSRASFRPVRSDRARRFASQARRAGVSASASRNGASASSKARRKISINPFAKRCAMFDAIVIPNPRVCSATNENDSCVMSRGSHRSPT